MYNFFRTRSGGEEKGRDSNREGGDGDGIFEHEGAVLGLVVFVVVVVGGGEVDARAALQGGKECGGDGGADPIRYPV